MDNIKPYKPAKISAMPFTIELCNLHNKRIKIQTVNNTLTFYFLGDEAAVQNNSDAWSYLQEQFIDTIPEYIPNHVRGSDQIHLKRNHTAMTEIEALNHYHIEFRNEITPEVFALYFHSFFAQQLKHSESKYQFFIAQNEVDALIRTYDTYYREYKNTASEALFNSEKSLTEKEKDSYNEHVINEMLEDDESPDIPLLVHSGRYSLYAEGHRIAHIEAQIRRAIEDVSDAEDTSDDDSNEPLERAAKRQRIF